jgi:hypothetical protein
MDPTIRQSSPFFFAQLILDVHTAQHTFQISPVLKTLFNCSTPTCLTVALTDNLSEVAGDGKLSPVASMDLPVRNSRVVQQPEYAGAPTNRNLKSEIKVPFLFKSCANR